MIKREMQKTARNLWMSYPVLTVTGPRQSGKTTLVRMEFPECEYVNLEMPDVRAEAISDARGFLSRHPAPVIFDEIQNVPELVSYIQAIVDESGHPSQYILTGSHQPALQAAVTQSLAGRTGLLELLPLSLSELKTAKIVKSRDECLYEGFMPRLYGSGLNATQLFADYFRTYVERDVRQLSNLRNLRTFEGFVRLLAGRVGQLLNIDSLASDSGVSSSTVREWLSLLEASYVIYVLKPYYRNFGKRFIKAPKVYFTDVGLVSYLLGIRSVDQVATHPLLGGIFENLIVLEMRKSRLNRGDDGDLFFMRTSHGVEVDVVSEREGKIDLTEIKAGSTFNDGMADNLRLIRKFLPDEVGRCQVVYSGHAASVSDGIPFVSFQDSWENPKGGRQVPVNKGFGAV